MEKIIFHIDVNNAFLSWESVHRMKMGDATDYRTLPAVIGGDEDKRCGIVLAKSYPAKSYGIKTGEPLFSARKKCPGLIVLPSHYEIYEEYSKNLFDYLKTLLPDVVPISIDECFADFTSFKNPVTSANALKKAIYEKFGFTVNIGIGSCGLLAKMASDFKKPDMVHTLLKEEIPEKMWPLPVGDLFMVGRKTEEKLKKLGIHTIGELAKTDIGFLKRFFKSYGNLLKEFANGRECVPLYNINTPPIKGIGNSVTLPKDVTSVSEAAPIFLAISSKVGKRLRSEGLFAKGLCISYRDYQFSSATHQKVLMCPTSSTMEIYNTALELFTELNLNVPIRSLGVRAFGLTKNPDGQLCFFKNPSEKQKSIDKAMDFIENKYGEFAVTRARLCCVEGTIGNNKRIFHGISL